MNRRLLLSLFPALGAASSTVRSERPASVPDPNVETATLISPLLCGCKFHITARWPSEAIHDGVSFQFPVPYTITALSATACPRHRREMAAPIIEDPYFGSPGYIRLTTQGQPLNQTVPDLLDPAKATPAQRLFIHHFRFVGNVTHAECGCRTYHTIDRADRAKVEILHHPKHTRVCPLHAGDRST